MFGRRSRRTTSRREYDRYSFGFSEYVTVDEKKARSAQAVAALRKKNPGIAPVIATGRKLAKNWWGIAWNQNLERYADYSNRLDRGKSYLRTGAVLDLQIQEGVVNALVQGSDRSPYKLEIKVDRIAKAEWDKITEACGKSLSSVQTLLTGQFPDALADLLTVKGKGLFPSPKEIHIFCSCPDYARLCKHAAAVLYGIGVRLDENPELFFTLRGRSMEQLVKVAVNDQVESMLEKAGTRSRRALAGVPAGIQAMTSQGESAPRVIHAPSTQDLSALFSIELGTLTEKGTTRRRKNDPATTNSRELPGAPSLESKALSRISKSPIPAGAKKCGRPRKDAVLIAAVPTIAPVVSPITAGPRKRGRPRKDAVSAASTPVVAPTASPMPAVPRKRGRPRKDAVSAASTPVVAPTASPMPAVPRKRGRPRKDAVSAASTPVITSTASPVPAAPRKRGRPRKDAVLIAAVPTITTTAPAASSVPVGPKKRGRPRKS